MNKRIKTTLASISLLALALTGCSTPAGTTAVPSAGPTSANSSVPADLSTAAKSQGDIVVNGQGMSVYVFDTDVKDSGKSSCTGVCQALWPAVTAGSDSPVLDGVAGTPGVITTAAGTRQLTLNGMPLYLFAKDSAPGDVKGQGVKNVWWVLTPAGAKVKTPAK